MKDFIAHFVISPDKPVPVCLSPPPGGGAGDDYGTAVRRHHLPHGDRKVKVVRLSELISVLRLPPNAEACPMVSLEDCCYSSRVTDARISAG